MPDQEPGQKTGKLVILSGPSGVGKSSVVRQLIRQCELPLELSVSATTRKPRKGEIDGVNYHFLSDEEFARRRNAEEFLECMEVFGRGCWYGTLKETVTTGLNQGKWVLLEIDVDGAMKVLQSHPEAITLFIHPGSMEDLEDRLRSRGTETEESIRRRLEVAQHEMQYVDRYQFVVVNKENQMQETVQEICTLLTSCGE